MDINDLADKLISKISKCSSNNNSDAVKIEPAIVSYVYSNGNVDVYFPPKDESTKVLTNIQNQTNFILKEGDSVEVLEPKGKLSNCWVIAKHGGGDLKTSASTVTKVQIISSGGTSDTFVETDPTVPTWAKAETKPTYTATEIGLGNVPNVSTNDQTPTYTDTDMLATLTSGETISTVFSKIKKAITSLIDHINNISNPHNVTASQVGLGIFETTATNIKMNGTQGVGVLSTVARADHIHPVDTSRAPVSHTHTVSSIVDLTATATELNYVDGVTSNIQSQLDSKYSSDNLPLYPVTSVNGKQGIVVLSASDVSAISIDDITTVLGSSMSKVPSEKAVADAISNSGGGDMSKVNYATQSDSIVDQSFKAEKDGDGNIITSTYSKNKIEINVDQPSSQNINDFWYKIL